MVEGSILGTGGWLPPEEREALDWLTLVKFMGWKARLVRSDNLTPSVLASPELRYLIIAGEPDELSGSCIDLLLEKVREEHILIIARAGRAEGRFAQSLGISRKTSVLSGEKVHWIGPGSPRTWHSRGGMVSLPELHLSGQADIWTTMGTGALIAGKRLGKGRIALISFHPSEARDRVGIFTTLLKHLLIWGTDIPVAWLDWSNTLVLRMDDPGSAQTVYHETYNNNKLGEAEWAMVGAVLEQYNARLSIGYVPGWVDDGDAERGVLLINGQTTEREAGKIHPSSKVCYLTTRRGAPMVYDYEAEFRGIQRLQKAGSIDVELHGFTHIHPDKKQWLEADDKYTNAAWYREFGQRAADFLKNQSDREHPLYAGLGVFSDIFQTFPAALICPGEAFTNDVLEKALHAGLNMVSSYYQCIRIGLKFCWAQHVCAPYLDKAEPAWFEPELPVIGYFHDFDLGIHGADWLAGNLAAWHKTGAETFISLTEMAGRLNWNLYLEQTGDGLYLAIEKEKEIGLVRPVMVGLRIPGEDLPKYISVADTGGDHPLHIHDGSNGHRLINVPDINNIEKQSILTIPQ